MYDMYRWDPPDEATDAGSGRAVNGTEHPGRRAMGDRSSAAQAVQVALDRRDNGGDSGASRYQ